MSTPAAAEASIRDTLLQDPAVKEAVRKAGANAMSDPEVQKQILKACKEKFPEVAGALQAKVVNWANDPEVQKQAYQYAGVAKDYGWKAVSQVATLIEQGPAGVRLLAFFGALASCVNSALVFTGFMNPVGALTHLVDYVMASYQVIFAITAMLFEAKPEWIDMVRGLDSYQNMLLEKAKFLSEVLGRGIFYGFQGTLWLMFASFSAPQNFALGIWFLLMSMLHICMHFGIMPMDLVAKMQQVRSMGLSAVHGERPPVAASAGQEKQPLLLEEAAGRVLEEPKSRSGEGGAPAAAAEAAHQPAAAAASNNPGWHQPAAAAASNNPGWHQPTAAAAATPAAAAARPLPVAQSGGSKSCCSTM